MRWAKSRGYWLISWIRWTSQQAAIKGTEGRQYKIDVPFMLIQFLLDGHEADYSNVRIRNLENTKERVQIYYF